MITRLRVLPDSVVQHSLVAVVGRSVSFAVNSMKFVADVMLGRLARWMRFAGYDVEYDNSASDELLRMRSKHRMLLTKDRELHRCVRKGRSYLVQTVGAPKQFEEIRNSFPLIRARARCIECNIALKTVSRKKVAHLVPPFVYDRQDQFFQCRACGKIYWPGTHYERMMRMLE